MPKHHHQHGSLDIYLQRLKESRLKLTPARKVIIETLLREHGPFSVDELSMKLKKVCDLATIYRNMLGLEQSGLLKRCDFGDGVARYELISADADHHHHHLVCVDCKKVELIELPNVEKSINSFVSKTRFKQVSHSLELFGVCPNCQ